MKRDTLLILTALYLACSCSNLTDKPALVFNSTNVRDSFELYVDFPDKYSRDSSNSIVFYMDANLKMGKELRRQIKLDENKATLDNVIFVGVGHIGDFRKLRRRDFIPPKIENAQIVAEADTVFGRGHHFYKFLISELIPYISQTFPNNGYYSFIGHSFSGLFSFYCLLQPDNPFKNHVALSPSLWVNYDNFFELESEFKAHQNRQLNATLYHACGSREWLNKVRGSSRRMRDTLASRNYPGLNYIYQEHRGKTHNGVVPVSLEYVLKEINFKPSESYR